MRRNNRTREPDAELLETLHRYFADEAADRAFLLQTLSRAADLEPIDAFARIVAERLARR